MFTFPVEVVLKGRDFAVTESVSFAIEIGVTSDRLTGFSAAKLVPIEIVESAAAPSKAERITFMCPLLSVEERGAYHDRAARGYFRCAVVCCRITADNRFNHGARSAGRGQVTLAEAVDSGGSCRETATPTASLPFSMRIGSGVAPP